MGEKYTHLESKTSILHNVNYDSIYSFMKSNNFFSNVSVSELNHI